MQTLQTQAQQQQQQQQQRRVPQHRRHWRWSANSRGTPANTNRVEGGVYVMGGEMSAIKHTHIHTHAHTRTHTHTHARTSSE